MSSTGRYILMALLLGGGILTTTASFAGAGASAFKDHQTINQIKKNCPDYYHNRNGECLRTTFRSVYFLRTVSGGSGGVGGGSGGK